MSSASVWRRDDNSNYFSSEYKMRVRGKEIEKYMIRRNPYGKGWAVFFFDMHAGDYKLNRKVAPLETLKEMKSFVDTYLR